jgi:hypothetical protein
MWNVTGYYPTYPWVQYFTLSSSYWSGGDADCTATPVYWNGRRWIALTNVSFRVYA